MNKLLIGLALLTGVLQASAESGPSLLGSFNVLVTYTVTNGVAGGTAGGMPLLLKFSEGNPAGFTYADCDPQEMRFGDADFNPLPFEIDTWDPSGESLVWVKAPLVENAVLNLVYDGVATVTNEPTAVWTDYSGVWHFSTLDTTAAGTYSQGVYSNSTASGGIDGNLSTYSLAGETGRFGKCFRVNDSTGKQVGNYNKGGVFVNDAGAGSPIDGGQNFTISGWFKHGNFDYYWDHYFYKRKASGNTGSPNNAFAIEGPSGALPSPYVRGSSGLGKAFSLSGNLKNTWGYLTFVFEGTTFTLYENGVFIGWGTITACIDNDAPLVFADNTDVATGLGDAAWNGWIDEVRFAKGSKSAAWVAAEYAAMMSAGLLSAGDVQILSAVARPAFAPATPWFHPSTNVTLTRATDGAAIYYTTDGSDPTEASTLYTAPIFLTSTTTIKARAYKADLDPSAIATATYTYAVPAPPAFGTVTATPDATKVTISGTIASVGNYGATACDVYFALGTSAESLPGMTKIASGATSSFNHVMRGLVPETTYYYALSISNNAVTVRGAATSGSFTTPVRPESLPPVAGDSVATRQLVQEAIDDAAAETPVGTVVLGEGLFEIDTQLMVTNGVTLQGQGWEQTIIKQTTSGANARCVTLDGGATVKKVALTGGRVTGSNYQFGGGAFVNDGTVSWCCITNNSVVSNNTKYGGGVGFFQSKGQVDHSIIADNYVSSAYGDNGGGGIGVKSSSGAITIDSCLVRGNRAYDAGTHLGYGGGIGIDSVASPVTIRNTTIVGNTAGESGTAAASQGGAILVKSDTGASKLTMLNCIISDNTTVNTNTTVQLSYAGGVDYCLFDTAADLVGANSKSGDPMFTNAAKHNYHLAEGSPAIHAGVTYAGIGTDLDDVAFAAKPSMGCYEKQQFALVIVVR